MKCSIIKDQGFRYHELPMNRTPERFVDLQTPTSYTVRVRYLP